MGAGGTPRRQRKGSSRAVNLNQCQLNQLNIGNNIVVDHYCFSTEKSSLCPRHKKEQKVKKVSTFYPVGFIVSYKSN